MVLRLNFDIVHNCHDNYKADRRFYHIDLPLPHALQDVQHLGQRYYKREETQASRA